MSVRTILESIERAFRSGGLDVASDPATDIAETIRHALAAAGLAQRPDSRGRPQSANAATAESVERADPPPAAPARTCAGSFLERSHTGPAGTRAYKLYVPARAPTGAMPLIVMLHGCKQDPGDFAVGTHMNALAEQRGFLVAYPAQSRNANGSNCWNWFRSADQARDGGEPSILAGIARDVIEAEGVDPQRVFVAGLSAGAAMAVILGNTHPDVFKAVGAHSGLPHGAARDVGSAFAAMHGGGLFAASSATRGTPGAGVPTIVFHGDQDSTVAVANAAAIVDQAVAANASRAPLFPTVLPRTSSGGREFTRTLYANSTGRTRVENWLLHGGAHAWSGGDTAGSYADANGPDASVEMVRFFMSQR